jgi:AcrR family transcriptional regulator
MAAAATHSTREEILDAALEAFTAKGFTATTVEDIRGRSGASIGSIYHHFGGKEQIAAALYVEGLARYQDGLLAVLRRERTAERGVKAMVRHHLRWVAANRELAGFLLMPRESVAVAEAGERIRELNRAVFAETADWYDAHARAGSVRPLAFDLIYSIVLGPAQEFARHWLAGRSRTSIKQAERPLADAAWGAVAVKGDTS